MLLSGKISSWWRTNQETKFLFVQAWCWSAVVKFTLTYLPYRYRLNWQGKAGETSPANEPQQELFLRNLKTAMVWCEKYTPWKTECYTLALTAKLLLRQKQVPGTLYIGFRKSKEKGTEGHAWLKAGNLFVTGGSSAHQYIVHASYS